MDANNKFWSQKTFHLQYGNFTLRHVLFSNSSYWISHLLFCNEKNCSPNYNKKKQVHKSDLIFSK